MFFFFAVLVWLVSRELLTRDWGNASFDCFRGNRLVDRYLGKRVAQHAKAHHAKLYTDHQEAVIIQTDDK